MQRVFQFLTSLQLTVVLLAASMVLVFAGTLAQVHEGLYAAQARFFKSWFVFGLHIGPERKIPVPLPGGYLLGVLLLVNLLAAHVKRFQLTWKKAGIHLTHAGVVMLLVGQLLTDMLSTESAMRLAEGEAKNYSEDFHANELVVIDTSAADQDHVVAIPETLLARRKEIRHDKLPVTLRVKHYWPNSGLTEQARSGSVPVEATEGIGRGLHVLPMQPTISDKERNLPSAVIEVLGADGKTLGSWLVTSRLSSRQSFSVGGRTFELAMRFTRHYKPFFLRLLEFTHEKYAGTETPKNFASRVRLQRPGAGEDREVKIYMNNPLRYEGETFYQAGFDENNDQLVNKVTILQVVRNPGWLTPYLACGIVTAGLIVQFLIHLVGFAGKRRSA
jgi:hypothetical protein